MTIASSTQTIAHADTNSHPGDGLMPGEMPRRPHSFPATRIGDPALSDRGTAVSAVARDHGPVERHETQQEELVLACLECGTASGHARGWKAFLDEEGQLLVYCAGCADREFGE